LGTGQLNGEAACGWRKSDRNEAEIIDSDAGEAALFALRVFVGEEIKSFVFLERSAKSESGLRARVCLFHRIENSGDGIDLTREAVACLKGLIAEIAEEVAVNFVGAAFGDDVNDAARGAAIFRVVIAEDELEFLDGFLRNGRADAVDGIVNRVGAIDADHVGAGARAVDVEAAVGSRT